MKPMQQSVLSSHYASIPKTVASKSPQDLTDATRACLHCDKPEELFFPRLGLLAPELWLGHIVLDNIKTQQRRASKKIVQSKAALEN